MDQIDAENQSEYIYVKVRDISNNSVRLVSIPRPSNHLLNSNLSKTPSSSEKTHTSRHRMRSVDEVVAGRKGVRPANDFQVNNNIQEGTGNGVFLSHDPAASPRPYKQKRSVGNGCISPNNVSKAKQLATKESDSSVSNNVSNAYSAPPVSNDNRELNAGGSDSSYSRKGKGVMTHPCSSKEPDSKNKNSQRRRSINFNEKAIGPRDYNKDAGESLEAVFLNHTSQTVGVGERVANSSLHRKPQTSGVTRNVVGLRGRRHRHPNRFLSLLSEVMDPETRFQWMALWGQVRRDNEGFPSPYHFTEHDYERIMALYDSLYPCNGPASARLINGLPQSTVESENFDETCVVCLETPTVGDTIRHLPCLHKFHKDCIDMWLRKNSSCPICKSSVA